MSHNTLQPQEQRELATGIVSFGFGLAAAFLEKYINTPTDLSLQVANPFMLNFVASIGAFSYANAWLSNIIHPMVENPISNVIKQSIIKTSMFSITVITMLYGPSIIQHQAEISMLGLSGLIILENALLSGINGAICWWGRPRPNKS